MIRVLIEEFKAHYPGKILERSRPSEEGSRWLKKNLSTALDEAEIEYRFSE
jgi:hypothetical protein